MIPRLLENRVVTDLKQVDKAVLVLGARQVGKTTLLKDIQAKISNAGTKTLFLNCDIEEQLRAINTTSITVLTQLLQSVDLLFMDEAQRLDNPGLTVKIIHENFPNIRVVATGSKPYNKPLRAYEFKYAGNQISKGAHSFANVYKTEIMLVNKENYLEFIK